MFKNINWNVLVPTILGGVIVAVAVWFVTKPDGLLSKFSGNGSGK